VVLCFSLFVYGINTRVYKTLNPWNINRTPRYLISPLSNQTQQSMIVSFSFHKWHPDWCPGPSFLQPDLHFSQEETHSELQGVALQHQPPDLLHLLTEIGLETTMQIPGGDVQRRWSHYTMRLQVPSLYLTWLSTPVLAALFPSKDVAGGYGEFSGSIVGLYLRDERGWGQRRVQRSALLLLL